MRKCVTLNLFEYHDAYTGDSDPSAVTDAE